MTPIRIARSMAAAALAALMASAFAQSPPPMTIGILSSGTYENRESLDRALMQGLQDQGYVEGRNLTVIRRYGASRSQQNAAELAGMKLDAVLTTCSPSTITMKEASSTTPIVMAAVSDPVRQGIIDSYAKPGRNVTGMASQDEDLVSKRLEVLHALAPSARTIAVLSNPRNPAHASAWLELERQLKARKLVPLRYEITGATLESAMVAAGAAGATALFVMPDDPLMLNLRYEIVRLAKEYRMPAIYWAREFVDAGGLASYGQSLPSTYRAAAGYMLRIRHGAAPGSLPVSQPTQFEMVVSETAANALGVAISPAIRASADIVR